MFTQKYNGLLIKCHNHRENSLVLWTRGNTSLCNLLTPNNCHLLSNRDSPCIRIILSKLQKHGCHCLTVCCRYYRHTLWHSLFFYVIFCKIRENASYVLLLKIILCFSQRLLLIALSAALKLHNLPLWVGLKIATNLVWKQ